MAAAAAAAADDDHDQQPCIATVKASIIRPCTPTPPHHMFLSAADIMWRWFHYNQRILFFNLHTDGQSGLQFFSFVEKMKQGLAMALVEFYPWAGRLFEQADGRLALDCNDAGVPFIEAEVDLSYSRLKEVGFQCKPFFKSFAPHGDTLKWTGPDLPLMSVQVTRFSGDGGVVIGIGHSHVVADGSSLWHFIKSWGECARGQDISSHPLHMRHELEPAKLILPLREDGLGDQRSITQGGKLGDWPHDHKFVQHDFHFTSKMVKKLKDMAASSLGSPSEQSSRFSSFQALCAHIWKHVIAAAEIDKEKKSGFYVVANMRSRLVPPLPETFFGNAIVRHLAIATVKEIEEESLGKTAARIQEAIRFMDDKFFKEFFGKVEVLEPMRFFDDVDVSMFSLQVSSSPRFPVYEVDFGWGPPDCARIPFIHSHGEMMWSPGREGGGSVDVSVALTAPVMERLGQDPSFSVLQDSESWKCCSFRFQIRFF